MQNRIIINGRTYIRKYLSTCQRCDLYYDRACHLPADMRCHDGHYYKFETNDKPTINNKQTL